jgi:two-component sensor histidine kinase
VSKRRKSPARRAREAPLPLSEINHRIANHLALVSGLVRLHASSVAKNQSPIAPGDASMLLIEAAERIDAVARLHRFLMQAPSNETVDLGEHLQSLCEAQQKALGAERGLIIRMTCARGMTAPLSAALPIAFIVTEVVTNAFKYARRETPGVLTVSCAHEPTGVLVLDMEDNGAGLPEGFDPGKDGGLGFRVMRALTEQIRGTLTFRSTPTGLAIRLSAPLNQDEGVQKDVGAAR